MTDDQQTPVDGYYDEDELDFADEDLDLSFLDDEEEGEDDYEADDDDDYVYDDEEE